MNKKLIITKYNNVRTFFYLVENKVQAIQCFEEDSLIGNIYVGRVSNVLKNLNALFVDIMHGESCYLSLEDLPDGAKVPRVGDLLTVMVTKDKIKTKQATVTTKLALTGECVVVNTDSIIGISKKITDSDKRQELKTHFEATIENFKTDYQCENQTFGGIIRTGAEECSIEYLNKETITLLCKLKGVIHRSNYATAYSCIYKSEQTAFLEYKKYLQLEDIDIISDDDEFISICSQYDLQAPYKYDDQMIDLKSFYGLKSIVDKALQERAYLKSGAYLVIQPTEAMTVIDVNSGKAIKGSNNEEALLKLNLEAAKDIARQLRIRNISGIVIVDFINMKSELDNKTLLQALREYVASDWVDTVVHDITRLGLVEITRKKVRKPIHEIIKNT